MTSGWNRVRWTHGPVEVAFSCRAGRAWRGRAVAGCSPWRASARPSRRSGSATAGQFPNPLPGGGHPNWAPAFAAVRQRVGGGLARGDSLVVHHSPAVPRAGGGPGPSKQRLAPGTLDPRLRGGTRWYRSPSGIPGRGTLACAGVRDDPVRRGTHQRQHRSLREGTRSAGNRSVRTRQSELKTPIAYLGKPLNHPHPRTRPGRAPAP